MDADFCVTQNLRSSCLSRLAGMLFSPEEQSHSKTSPEDEAAALRRSTKNLRKLVLPPVMKLEA